MTRFIDRDSLEFGSHQVGQPRERKSIMLPQSRALLWYRVSLRYAEECWCELRWHRSASPIARCSGFTADRRRIANQRCAVNATELQRFVCLDATALGQRFIPGLGDWSNVSYFPLPARRFNSADQPRIIRARGAFEDFGLYFGNTNRRPSFATS